MLECGNCEKETRCLKRFLYARAVLLAWVNDEPEPECLDFEEKKPYWRALEWRKRA